MLHKRGDCVPKALSVSLGAAFLGFAAAFSHPRSHLVARVDLHGECRVRYLDFLRSFGLRGIYGFLSSFVGSLAARDRRWQRQRSAF